MLKEWSTGHDLCSWGRKEPGVRVDVRVSCFEPDLEDIVSMCQARGVIVGILREAVCHRQHKLRESVKREVWIRVLDIRSE